MPKAIIIEDSKFMRRVIREALEKGGHEVLGEGDDGLKALSLYKEFKPDFMTMDITMGGLSGIKAARGIKEYDAKAKIIVISALNEKTIKLQDKTIDVSAFVLKPFDAEDLLTTINKVLKK